MSKLVFDNPLSLATSNKIRKHIKFEAKHISKLWFIKQPPAIQNKTYAFEQLNNSAGIFVVNTWNKLAKGKTVIADEKLSLHLPLEVQAEIIDMVEGVFKEFKISVLNSLDS